ncbi:E3 ubiquitin-protein ligase DZIP3-like [Actinia tenebrosa]|uniref:E3 ubiquitin-protein ligase DZIP3-like n=1 Tax=Actinia tenebrosa TaxID=6105 RepID=A0A6P8J590_ACTTE|nr:E3 ubiquitin-protein ligase DZIP3-like [Actinia tenebrosa]
MASASWYKETDEKINYTKLCRLLVDGGTQAVCSVFDGKYPPSSLKAFLNANKTSLQKLKKPKGKVLNNEQWDKLYPPNGSDPQSKDFDITLLFVLLRNICGLTRPATGWDVLPHATDNSLEANLARIKYYRNNAIAHKPNTEINDADFKQHWQDISSALQSLGLCQDDIDDLKSSPLGEKDYNQLLYDWYISDKDVKIQLEDLKSDLKSDTTDLKSDTADLKSDTADLKSDTANIKSDTTDLKSDTADIKSDTTDLKSDTADINNILTCRNIPITVLRAEP